MEALELGAPLPRPEIVRDYWTDNAKADLMLVSRETVGGSVDRMFEPT
jgi:hypothetical protein